MGSVYSASPRHQTIGGGRDRADRSGVTIVSNNVVSVGVSVFVVTHMFVDGGGGMQLGLQSGGDFLLVHLRLEKCQVCVCVCVCVFLFAFT